MEKTKIKHHKHKKSPWVTNEILHSIKHRDYLYKKLKCTPPDSPTYGALKINFNTYKNILRKMIREAKCTYYSNYFSKFQNSMGKTWKKINEIIGKKRDIGQIKPSFLVNDTLIENEQEIAEEFKNFFNDVTALPQEQPPPGNACHT